MTIGSSDVDEVQSTQNYEATQKLDFINDKKIFVDRLISGHKDGLYKLLTTTMLLFVLITVGLNIYILLEQIKLLQNILHYFYATAYTTQARARVIHYAMPILNGFIELQFPSQKEEINNTFVNLTVTECNSALAKMYDELSSSQNSKKYYNFIYEKLLIKKRLSLGVMFEDNGTFYDVIDSVQSHVSQVAYNTSFKLTIDQYFYIIHNAINSLSVFLSDLLVQVTNDSSTICNIKENTNIVSIFSIVICCTNIIICAFLAISFFYSKVPSQPIELFLTLSSEFCNIAHQNCEEFMTSRKFNLEKIEEYDDHAKQLEQDDLTRIASDCTKHRRKRYFKNSLHLMGFSWKSTIAVVLVINILYIVSFAKYTVFMDNILKFNNRYITTNRVDYALFSSIIALMIRALDSPILYEMRGLPVKTDIDDTTYNNAVHFFTTRPLSYGLDNYYTTAQVLNLLPTYYATLLNNASRQNVCSISEFSNLSLSCVKELNSSSLLKDGLAELYSYLFNAEMDAYQRLLNLENIGASNYLKLDTLDYKNIYSILLNDFYPLHRKVIDLILEGMSSNYKKEYVQKLGYSCSIILASLIFVILNIKYTAIGIRNNVNL